MSQTKVLKRSGKRGIESMPAQIILVILLVIVLLLVAMPLLVTLVMSVKGPDDIMNYPIWTLPVSGWYFSNYSEAFAALSMPMLYTVLLDLGATFIVMFGSCYIAFLLFQGQLDKGMIMPYLKQICQDSTQGVQYAMYMVSGIPLIISTIVSIKFFVSGDFASGMKL